MARLEPLTIPLEFIAEVDWQLHQRCPVCEGRGLVPAGFYAMAYTGTTNAERCRRCDGLGTFVVGTVPHD